MLRTKLISDFNHRYIKIKQRENHMKSQPSLQKNILLAALLTCGVCSSAHASFASRNYFPIPASGSTWTYNDNCGFGVTTVTLSVTGNTAPLNGKTAKQISHSSTESDFFSSDATSGIQFHRYMNTDPMNSETLTLTPAYTFAPAMVTLGTPTNNSGTFADSDPLVTAATYSGVSTSTAFELVSTPAGPFRALRTNFTLNLSYSYNGTAGFYDNQTSTRWNVRGVGIVKVNETFTGFDGASYSESCTIDITTQNWRPIANFTVRNDALFDFGAGGLWMRTQNGAFTQIHTANPAQVLASADIDGNGQNDIVIDFGAGIGTYVWMNNSTYVFLHSSSPEGVYAANLNANAQTDLIIDFGAAGLWRYVDNATYTRVSGANAANIVVANINGSGVDDFVVEFSGGLGIYAYVDNNIAAPVFVHPGALNNIARGDIDGDGSNNVIFDFTVGGIWNYDYNSGTFTRIHGGTANHIVRADLDENGVADLVIDLASGGGIWSYMNNTGFSFIHSGTAINIETNEWNNAGSSDILIDFGAGGLWVWQDNSGFVYIRSGNIDSITATEVNKL